MGRQPFRRVWFGRGAAVRHRERSFFLSVVDNCDTWWELEHCGIQRFARFRLFGKHLVNFLAVTLALNVKWPHDTIADVAVLGITGDFLAARRDFFVEMQEALLDRQQGR